MYVARAEMFGAILPGKLVAGEGCYVAHGGEEYKASQYEVLVISPEVKFGWESNSLGVVPREALCGGRTSVGEPLYVGRGVFEGVTICGKILRTHGCLYISQSGKEYDTKEYEVLVVRSPIRGVKWINPKNGDIPSNAVIVSAIEDTFSYVARAAVSGSVLPGKLVVDDGCYACYESAEHRVADYEVLTISPEVAYEWEPNYDGKAPKEALIGGFSSHGEPLYIGRGVYNDVVIGGQIQRSRRCLVVGFKGKKHAIYEYDVLVIKSPVEGINWVRSQYGEIPDNAVLGGHDGGDILYVARAMAFGDVLPGKLVTGHCCYVAYLYEEHEASDYEVLTISDKVTYDWETNSWGRVTKEALYGGITSYGEQLYIGRGVVGNATICGKIHRSHGCLFVGREGKEHALRKYEVLVIKSPIEGIEWVTCKDNEPPENAVRVGFDGVDVIYVARAAMFGDVLPGKLVPGEGCYVSFAGKDHKAPEYEVLVISSTVHYDWEVHFRGEIPKKALAGGVTANGQKLYIGRGFCKEATISGKIQQGKGGLLVGYEGQEHKIVDYEVLVIKSVDDDNYGGYMLSIRCSNGSSDENSSS